MNNVPIRERLNVYLKELRLSTIRSSYETYANQAETEGMSYEQYLLEVIEREYEVRRKRRIERHLKESRLPLDKSFENFDLKRLPINMVSQIKNLLEGYFLDNKENVLTFGNPGSGKTHLLCGIGQELILKGRQIYFCTCSMLIQELLSSKQDLRLSRLIKKLSKYEAIIIDDIGYVQQSREEMEVLFTLLSERYERGSIMLTSNIPFSKWENIFKDPMTTAAAIDRLVHHCIILELNIPSYRMEKAKENIETNNT
jgi:DNA replication protein DnaC